MMVSIRRNIFVVFSFAILTLCLAVPSAYGENTSETDCNSNGIDDMQEILEGLSPDCNSNGIPDECEIMTYRDIELVVLFDTSGTMFEEILSLCGTMNLIVETLETNGATVTSEMLSIINAGAPAKAIADEYLFDRNELCWEGSVINRYGSTTPGLSYEIGNPEDWGSAIAVVAAEKQWSEGSRRIIIPISDEGPLGIGSPADQQQVIDEATAIALANDVVVSPIIGSPYDVSVMQYAESIAANAIQGGVALPSNVENIADTLTQIILAGTINWNDCNLNGVPDECDLWDGTSIDINSDGTPDECELDCNENGIADTVEIRMGTRQDCDGNLVPDECDIYESPELDCNMNWILDPCEPDEDDDGIPNGCEDCNGNGDLDWMDLYEGGSDDCNMNSIPDECEPDCNNNGIADECDIASGTSSDVGSNGIPDECEFVPPGGSGREQEPDEPEIEDADGDGVADADDNCILYSNKDQGDGDADGVGDACDNCVETYNDQQEDTDGDGVGDVCDNCVLIGNAQQDDDDNDGIGNACDNCPDTPNPGQEDGDANGIGDACEEIEPEQPVTNENDNETDDNQNSGDTDQPSRTGSSSEGSTCCGLFDQPSMILFPCLMLCWMGWRRR